MGRRINSQVDEANRAMWNLDYLVTAFFWFANSEDFPLQGQDEPVLP